MYYWAHSESIVAPSPGRLAAVQWPPNVAHNDSQNASESYTEDSQDQTSDDTISGLDVSSVEMQLINEGLLNKTIVIVCNVRVHFARCCYPQCEMWDLSLVY